MSTKDQTTSVLPTPSVDNSAEVTRVGRSVFLIETVAAGVAVRTVFLGEDQRLMDMPAIFPDLNYAMAQIDELKRAVAQHFAQAAQVGAQVIAAQAAQANVKTESASSSAVPLDAAVLQTEDAAT